MLIPLYGFLEGDTLGVLLLVQDTDRIEDVALRLGRAAQVRVSSSGRIRLYRAGRLLSPDATVESSGLSTLDRVDGRRSEHV